MYIISVAGPIAAGKSTFLDEFYPRLRPQMPSVNIWAMNEPQFWEDSQTSKLAAEYFSVTPDTPKVQDIVYRFQVAMLYDRANMIKEAIKQEYDVVLMERSPLEDEFFWNNLHQRGMIADRDLDVLFQTRTHLFSDFKIDVLISISIPAKDAYQNALKRAQQQEERAAELNIFPMETYEQMNEFYWGFELQHLAGLENADCKVVELKFSELVEDLEGQVNKVCDIVNADYHRKQNPPESDSIIHRAWEGMADLLDDSEILFQDNE